MKAIDFVVRDDAGALRRGTVGADAETTTIKVSSGQEISLNLRQVDLSGYSRAGDDLVMVLADGRIVVVENYFNDAGSANRMFISADGYLNELAFVETTDGELYAQYGPTEQWGKWSPSDDLIYLGRTEIADLSGAAVAADDEVSMLGAALLGGGGLFGGAAAAAAVVGGAVLLDGDETPPTGDPTGDDDLEDPETPNPATPANPTVDAPEAHSTVGGDDTSTHHVSVTGTGEPGDNVKVTAGDKELETTIGTDGKWSVTFIGDDFPSDGDMETVVVVTRNGELVEELDGPGFLIDTTPPALNITGGADSTGDLINSVIMDGGVTLTGGGEPGAVVEVSIQGITRTATVTQEGTWSVTYQSGVLEVGEYTSDITVVSRDAVGNTTTVTDTLVVDTITNVTIATDTVEGDGTINGAERADGVTLTGTAQAGSSVEVTFGNITRTATVDGNGNWTVDFTAAEIPTGEYDATVTAVATDTAGNATTTTGTVEVDTYVNALNYTSTAGGTDGVINATEAQSGLVVTGNAEAGSTVMVELGGVTTAAVVQADGTWSATFSSDQIQGGTYTTTMTATATDAAGNVDTITQSVRVDTDAGVLTISAAPVEGDDVINHVEASDGVVLSGTADPGAVVQVTLGTVTHSVVANSTGVWQAFYTAAEVPQGVYTADITATTTDAAGNSLTATDSVAVDTRVDNLSVRADIIEGDNIISGAERADGVVLTGTTEAGSSVLVTVGTVTVQAVVDVHGNWTAQFAPTQIPTGELDTNVTVTATDVAGNVASVTDTVKIDTLVNRLTMNDNIEGDNVVNATEASDGISLGGQVEAGSTVQVNFHGQIISAVVDVNGNWSVDIPATSVAPGTYDANISVTATDAYGNVDTISDTLRIDTDAPEGPVIASYTRDGDGIRGISTEMNPDDLTVSQVNADGSISDVNGSQVDIPQIGETNFQFNSDVPDGSHLIVTAKDDAGNMSGTYVVLDDESANSSVDLSNPQLGNYSINQVDLQFAEEAHLSINEAQLVGLSDDTNTLTIHGGQDDTVTITGASRTGQQTVDGQTYDVYSLGSEGTLIIDDDITVNTVIG